MAGEATMDSVLEVDGLRLSAHIARPTQDRGIPESLLPGVVVCHGFPVRGREAPASGKSFPELADRIAHEMGWLAMTMNFRGCGRSEGDFSLSGWVQDIEAAVTHLQDLGASAVWLAGFGSGGALTLCAGARRPDVRGVAAVSAPADFSDWARHPRRLVEHSRSVGVIKTPGYPFDFDRWAGEFRGLTAVSAAERLAPRPLLVMHGEVDDLVPSIDARAIADAHGNAELRIIAGGGHELRHDPRAIAVLLGWLNRQHNAAVADA
ncbi:MAG TPA: alpha/beta fold hydrolase [Microthrixaceae bacterium]|nr:alpha/beta fold hydrolase [Microthrixaceae bacterium]